MAKTLLKFATNDFFDGLKALCAASFSAAQALNVDDNPIISANAEAVTIGRLAVNALLDRPTGNGHGWGQCSIQITAFGCAYNTRGGLAFGWDVRPDWNGLDRDMSPKYTFWIGHPSGDFLPESTLLQSCIAAGFTDEV